MNILIITLLSSLLVVHAGLIEQRSVEAYYWRDFSGLLPSNAIAAGKDENGANTYIGQFSISAEYNPKKAPVHTIPGVIKVGSKNILAAYYGRTIHSNSTNNPKVLCYDSSNKYRWYSPTSTFPPSCRYVIAGNEDGIPMFVGRATHNKEVVVGKLFSENTHHRTELISPYNGGEIIHDKYEVLTHCA